MATTNLDEAFEILVSIPIVADFYEERDRPYLITLLNSNMGELKDGEKGYRPFAAGAFYIRSNPDRLLRKHDNTELASFDDAAKVLDELQAVEDGKYFKNDSKERSKFIPFGTGGIRWESSP